MKTTEQVQAQNDLQVIATRNAKTATKWRLKPEYNTPQIKAMQEVVEFTMRTIDVKSPEYMLGYTDAWRDAMRLRDNQKGPDRWTL